MGAAAPVVRACVTVAILAPLVACSHSPLGTPDREQGVAANPGSAGAGEWADDSGGLPSGGGDARTPDGSGGAPGGLASPDDGPLVGGGPGPPGGSPPPIPNGPQGGILEDDFCVGVGVTVPVIDQPPEAAPYFCGRNCAYAMDCPPGYQCWSVFEPGPLTPLANGNYVSPTRIVAYQCLPEAGTCPPGLAPGELCGACARDADCR